MDVKDLAGNPGNPRTVSPAKLAMLKKSLAEFGDLGGIVFNRKTKQLCGGHQRVSLFGPKTKIEIEKKYTTPTKTGTVAEGFVVLDGERFSYREVNWDETKEKAANIAANKGAGEWDFAKLGDWMRELDDFAFDLDLTMFDENERKDLLSASGSGLGEGGDDDYSKKIQSPIYEPKGECPPVKSLVDLTKTEKLLKAIASSKVPGDIQRFLQHAATRHSVFNYEQIAEYYAHAPKKVKELMEDSALVIIDFNKAIENGFVVLTEKLADAYAE